MPIMFKMRSLSFSWKTKDVLNVLRTSKEILPGKLMSKWCVMQKFH